MMNATHADLLHRIAHDLRSPLEVLRGTMGDLPSLASREEREHATRLASRALNRLVRLSEHLDLAASASQGAVRAAPSSHDVRALVSATLQRVQSAEPRSGVTVEVRGDATWHTDPRLLGAVLSELLSNALKNARSRVVVQLSLEALVVEDDGPGVPRERLATLFTGERPSLTGLGLGLPLADTLARLLGLELGVSPTRSGALSRFELRR